MYSCTCFVIVNCWQYLRGNSLTSVSEFAPVMCLRVGLEKLKLKLPQSDSTACYMCDSKALVKDTCHVRATCAPTVTLQHDNS